MDILDISEEAKNTTRCPFNLECLHNNKDWKPCRVVRRFPNGVLEIDGKCERTSCHYCQLFGNSMYLCHCPIRSEIYKRYNK